MVTPLSSYSATVQLLVFKAEGRELGDPARGLGLRGQGGHENEVFAPIASQRASTTHGKNPSAQDTWNSHYVQREQAQPPAQLPPNRPWPLKFLQLLTTAMVVKTVPFYPTH